MFLTLNIIYILLNHLMIFKKLLKFYGSLVILLSVSPGKKTRIRNLKFLFRLFNKFKYK